MWFDEGSLTQSISFLQLCATLPRLMLKSKTRFSAFLAKTFFLTFSGDSPCTAVFPLPLPHFGIFGKQGSLKLNRERWKRLCKRRLLHILIVFLNYQFNGLRPLPLEALRRSPNLAQLKIFQRLRGLITANDQPGEHPLLPGRSGPEFIARLIELSTFAQENSLFNTKGYAGTGESCEIELKGHIQQPFVPRSELLPLRWFLGFCWVLCVWGLGCVSSFLCWIATWLVALYSLD